MTIYNYNDLKRDFQEAKSIVENAGLTEVTEISYHLLLVQQTSFLGLTHYNYFHNYTIKLNQLYANTASHDDIINTLVHEVLHSLKNGMNHKAPWKSYALIIKNKTGINITRCHAQTESIQNYRAEKKMSLIAKNPEKVVYNFTCLSCGNKFSYQKQSKYVKRIMANPLNSGLRCSHCKGGTFSIEVTKLSDTI